MDAILKRVVREGLSQKRAEGSDGVSSGNPGKSNPAGGAASAKALRWKWAWSA